MDIISFRPLSHHVLVEYLDEASTTSGGIALPEGFHDSGNRQGIVRGVGPGDYDHGMFTPMGVNIGDRVLFGAYADDELMISGKLHGVVSIENVYGVIQA